MKQTEDVTDKEIRILFIEDVPAEADRVDRELHKDGMTFQSQRVDTREAFLSELERQPPDVILSDHGLPDFDGLAALAVAREKCPDVPFIFVTGALTPDMEIEKLLPGVTDYVSKIELWRLGIVIRRAVAETERRLWRRAEQRYEQTIKMLLVLLQANESRGGLLPICSSCKKIRDSHDEWHPPEVFFKAQLGLRFSHGICPDCVERFR